MCQLPTASSNGESASARRPHSSHDRLCQVPKAAMPPAQHPPAVASNRRSRPPAHRAGSHAWARLDRACRELPLPRLPPRSAVRRQPQRQQRHQRRPRRPQLLRRRLRRRRQRRPRQRRRRRRRRRRQRRRQRRQRRRQRRRRRRRRRQSRSRSRSRPSRCESAPRGVGAWSVLMELPASDMSANRV